MRRVLLACAALLLLAGCSGSSSPTIPTIPPARAFALSGFTPTRVTHPGTATIAFTVKRPSGAPLTSYRRGAGPHTGIHLIIVRRDLGLIIHRHPPIGPNGRIVQPVNFTSPGPYRLLVDVYPAVKGAPRNFQLHADVHVGGAYRAKPLPPFAPVDTVSGYRIALRAPRQIHPIDPVTLTATITDPSGKLVTFHPWYGALAHAIPLANRFASSAGGPSLVLVSVVTLALAGAISVTVLWLVALGVRERQLLRPDRVPPRLRFRRLALTAAGLYVSGSLAFAMFESYLHWRAGIGFHGLSCLVGPVHRNAIPVLAALALVAAAFAEAVLHLVGWMRAAARELLRPRLLLLPARPAPGLRLVSLSSSRVPQRARPRAPPLPA